VKYILRECLGGYYILDCRDLDEVLELPALRPWPRWAWPDPDSLVHGE
jgi:hypothetical protein